MSAVRESLLRLCPSDGFVARAEQIVDISRVRIRDGRPPSKVKAELLVLATGAGSLTLSHVNDTGFWLFKEYFGLTVPQTLRSWTMMETVVSLIGLVGCLGLSMVV